MPSSKTKVKCKTKKITNVQRKYKKEWEVKFPWVQPSYQAPYDKAKCKYCNKLLSLKFGVLQIHHNSVRHQRQCESLRIGDYPIDQIPHDGLKKNLKRKDQPTGIITKKEIIPEAEEEEEIETRNDDDFLISQISPLFSNDVFHMLKDNLDLREIVAKNPDLHNTSPGIIKLTKILVGEMAQKYLTDNVFKLTDYCIESSEDQIRSQISEVENKILQAQTQLEELKSKVPTDDSLMEINIQNYDDFQLEIDDQYIQE